MNHDEVRRRIKERYAFATWSGPGAALPRIRRNVLPRLDAVSGGATFESREVIPDSGHSFTDTYRVGPDARIAVTIVEYRTAQDAQEALVDLLMTLMALGLPRCEEKGLRAGDVCFCGFGDGVRSAYFTRDNVLVRVENAGRRDVDVSETARAIDAQIAAHPVA